MSETPPGPLRDRGVQPLDGIMERLGLKNTDLVRHSGEQLTHKMVSRGRKGRLLSRHVQSKILRALNASQSEKEFTLDELFNYRPLK